MTPGSHGGTLVEQATTGIFTIGLIQNDIDHPAGFATGEKQS